MYNFSEWLVKEGKRLRPLPGIARPPAPFIDPASNPQPDTKLSTSTGSFIDPTGKRIDQNAPGNLGDESIVRQVDRLNRHRIVDPKLSTQQIRNAQVQFGKNVEGHILQQCVDVCGYDILPPTNDEDMYEKIDGWWDIVKWQHKKKDSQAPMATAQPGETAHQVRRVPIQIKYRDSGDDILFEVIKPWRTLPLFSPANRTGRDVKPPDRSMSQWSVNAKGGPQYLFHLSRDGSMLTIAHLSSCYQLIENLLLEIDKNNEWGNIDQYTATPKVFTKDVKGAQCYLRLQRDGILPIWKVIAYIPFRALQGDIIDRCNVKIPLY